MFEVENLDYNVPRLCVKSVVKAELHDWSKQVSRVNQHVLNLMFSSIFSAFPSAVYVQTCDVFLSAMNRAYAKRDVMLVQLRCHASVSLDVSCYNDALSVWEPLLEPVMLAEDHYRPWQLTLTLAQAEALPVLGQAPDGADSGHVVSDELDSAVSYWLQHVTSARRSERSTGSSSAESDVDDVDGGDGGDGMTVIRPRAPPQLVQAAGGGGARSLQQGHSYGE